MIKKHTVIILLLFSLFSNFAFSLTISSSSTVDTYSSKTSGSPSFAIEGFLLDNVLLTAAIDYQKKYSYIAYSKVQYIGNNFTGGSSFGFNITNNSLYPTFKTFGSTHPFKYFGFELLHTFGINPYNIFSTSSVVSDTDIICYYYANKYDLSLDLGYSKEMDDSTEKKTFTGKLEMLAHQANVPLQIDLFTQVDALFENDPMEFTSIEIINGGEFKYDLGKWGTYFVNGEITSFSLTESTQPFSVTVGIIYTIDDSYTRIKATAVKTESVYENEETFSNQEVTTDSPAETDVSAEPEVTNLTS